LLVEVEVADNKVVEVEQVDSEQQQDSQSHLDNHIQLLLVAAVEKDQMDLQEHFKEQMDLIPCLVQSHQLVVVAVDLKCHHSMVQVELEDQVVAVAALSIVHQLH
jgi:hypothetical protein